MDTIESIRQRLAQAFAETSSADSADAARIPHPWMVFRGMALFHGRLVERWRSRRALERLDDHGLRDIGITRAQARREAARPFWD